MSRTYGCLAMLEQGPVMALDHDLGVVVIWRESICRLEAWVEFEPGAFRLEAAQMVGDDTTLTDRTLLACALIHRRFEKETAV